MPEVRVAIFASGSGTNFQRLVEHARAGEVWRVGLLVCDRDEAGVLERARTLGVSSRVIPVARRDPAEVGDEMVQALREEEIEAILLAGYLRLVPEAVVEAFAGRILNVHPALLPAFGGKGMYGMRVHEAAVRSGVRISGPTVHLVNERYDEGAIVAQWPVPVHANDTPDTLQQRVLEVEHRLFPLAADHLCRAVARGQPVGPMDFPGRHFQLTDRVTPALDPAVDA